MFNNSYLSGNQFSQPMYQNVPQYNSTQYLQPQRQSTMPLQSQPVQDVPFSYTMYATYDEAKAYIVEPNKRIMFIDRDKPVFYIKSADMMGKSELQAFKYSQITDNASEEQKGEIDTKMFVKTDDIKNFVTKEDLKDFLTKDDLKQIDEKLEKLNRLSSLIKGE